MLSNSVIGHIPRVDVHRGICVYSYFTSHAQAHAQSHARTYARTRTRAHARTHARTHQCINIANKIHHRRFIL